MFRFTSGTLFGAYLGTYYNLRPWFDKALEFMKDSQKVIDAAQTLEKYKS